MDDTSDKIPDAPRIRLDVGLHRMLEKNPCMSVAQAAALIDMLHSPRILSAENRVLKSFGVID